MLESHYYKDLIEAGCDEAGRAAAQIGKERTVSIP